MNNNIKIEGLEYREISKGEDIDYFIETLSYPINLNISIPNVSRLQFPKSRAILLRTSPYTDLVTVHVMRDIDLHSSFCNFEINLKKNILTIKKNMQIVDISIRQ